MNTRLRDDLYQIVEIVEGDRRPHNLVLSVIQPYLNEYIKVREVPRDNYITRGEESINKVYYIISGAYYMTRISEKGRMKVQAKRKAPQFIGIAQAVDHSIQKCFTSIAMEDSIVLEIKQDYFVNCVKENSELAIKVIKNISEKLVDATLEIDRLILNDFKEQLLIYIYRYWDENNMGLTTCRIAEKNGYTADNLGMSIRTFYRTLKTLKEEAFITVNKGYIEVTEKQIQKINAYLE